MRHREIVSIVWILLVFGNNFASILDTPNRQLQHRRHLQEQRHRQRQSQYQQHHQRHSKKTSSSQHQHRIAKRSRKLGNIHKACLAEGLDAEYTFVVQVSRELSQILIDRGRSDLWPIVEKVQIRYLRSRCIRRKNFRVTFKKLNKHYQLLDIKAKFIFLLSWTHVLFNRRYCRAQVHYLGYCLLSFDRAIDGPLFDGFEDLKKTLLAKSLDQVLQFSRLLMNSLEMNCASLESRPADDGERCMAMSVEFVVHLIKSSGSIEEAGEAALWNIDWLPPIASSSSGGGDDGGGEGGGGGGGSVSSSSSQSSKTNSAVGKAASGKAELGELTVSLVVDPVNQKTSFVMSPDLTVRNSNMNRKQEQETADDKFGK